jgi:hypothetical protein
MIQLGIIQVIGLQFAGLSAGLQGIHGTVFCSSPEIQYITSCIISSHWVMSTTCCDILGINRLCALHSTKVIEFMFGGKKLWLWMSFPILYGFLMFWFMKPNIFNSYGLAYFSNPHYGYIEVMQIQVILIKLPFLGFCRRIPKSSLHFSQFGRLFQRDTYLHNDAYFVLSGY